MGLLLGDAEDGGALVIKGTQREEYVFEGEDKSGFWRSESNTVIGLPG